MYVWSVRIVAFNWKWNQWVNGVLCPKWNTYFVLYACFRDIMFLFQLSLCSDKNMFKQKKRYSLFDSLLYRKIILFCQYYMVDCEWFIIQGFCEMHIFRTNLIKDENWKERKKHVTKLHDKCCNGCLVHLNLMTTL